MSWDPTLLEYVNHTVKIPIEDYPDGILFKQSFWVEEVNQSLGRYWLLGIGAPDVPVFNAPNENSTMFCMTFRGKKEGVCILNITELDLGVPIARPGFEDTYRTIPHWMFNGQYDIIPELHLFMLPLFITGTLVAILLKMKLKQCTQN